MKNKNLLSLVISFVLISLALTSVTTVYAAPPDIQIFHDEGSFATVDCGDFLALQDFVVDGRVTTFFDQAGNPVSVQVHMHYDGTFTNSITGLTLRDPARLTITVDLQDGTVTEAGLFYGITVPGQGIAVLDAGKIVFDADGNVLFVGGPHQFLEGGEALICAALD
jgi:hypothetical protein